jgi:hypothetical protein
MRTGFLLIFLVIGVQTLVHAQKFFTARANYVKVYQNLDYVRFKTKVWSDQQQAYVSSDNFKLYFNRFSAAFQLSKERWTHEFELSYSGEAVPIAWEQQIGYRTQYFSNRKTFVSLQYELLETFDRNNFNFLLGGGFSPYFFLFKSTPYLTSNFPAEQMLLGSTVNITGHAQYNLHHRWIIDLNLRFGLCDFRYEQVNIQNPQIPVSQQRVDTFEFKLLPQAYTLKLGVGYRI